MLEGYLSGPPLERVARVACHPSIFGSGWRHPSWNQVPWPKSWHLPSRSVFTYVKFWSFFSFPPITKVRHPSWINPNEGPVFRMRSGMRFISRFKIRFRMRLWMKFRMIFRKIQNKIQIALFKCRCLSEIQKFIYEMQNCIYELENSIYSPLQWNSPFAKFQKIGVAVSWVNIKMWWISHLKAFTATFKLM